MILLKILEAKIIIFNNIINVTSRLKLISFSPDNEIYQHWEIVP